MRTTLDIEDVILEAAKELARAQGVSTGKMISDLARKGILADREATAGKRGKYGLPTFPSRGEIITSAHVRRLMDAEGV